jgi:prefoldin alpha subunit
MNSMAENPNEQEMKQAYMEYQMVQQHVTQLQKQIETVQEQLQDIANVIANLDEMKKVKEGSEMLVPVANGVFMKTTLVDNKDLLVNVGGNTTVKKSFSEVGEMLVKQQKEMEEIYAQLVVQFQQLHSQSEKLEQGIQELVK